MSKHFDSIIHKKIDLCLQFCNGCFFPPFIQSRNITSTGITKNPKGYAKELYFSDSSAYQIQVNYLLARKIMKVPADASDPKIFIRSVLFFTILQGVDSLKDWQVSRCVTDGSGPFLIPGFSQKFQIDPLDASVIVGSDVWIVTILDRENYWKEKGIKTVVPEFFARKIWSRKISAIYALVKNGDEIVASNKKIDEEDKNLVTNMEEEIIDDGPPFLTKEEVLLHYPALSKVDLDDETILSPHRYSEKKWKKICDDIHQKQEWGKLSHFFEEYENFLWPKDEQEFLFDLQLEYVNYSFYERQLYLQEKIGKDIEFIKDYRKKPSENWKIGGPKRNKAIF